MLGWPRTAFEGVDKNLRLLHRETIGFSPASVTLRGCGEITA